MASSDVFTPFFSRRIGLDGGRPVPLDVGARVVSQGDRASAGAIVARQRGGSAGRPGATFGVARLTRNVGASGRVGGLAVVRHTDALGGGVDGRTNAVVTFDGFARLSSTAAVTAAGAFSRTSGDGGEGVAAHVWLRNRASWGYVGLVEGLVTRGFTAETGFLRRADLVVTSPALYADLRPSWLPRGVRALAPGFEAYAYHRASDGRFQEATAAVYPLVAKFDNGADLGLRLDADVQRIAPEDTAAFRPLGLRLMPGRYRTARVAVYGATDPSRRLSARLNAGTGPFFDGRLVAVTASLRAAPSPRLALAVDYKLARATNVGPSRASATSHLLVPELRLALTPRLLGLVVYQYSALEGTGAWNARLSWEFQPLSYLHLVFNDARAYQRRGVLDGAGTRGAGSSSAGTSGAGTGAERGVIAKLSYLRAL